MNFQKDPRHARKLAKQQKHLRRVARHNPEQLQGRERAMVDWDVELDNYVEPIEVEKGYDDYESDRP